MEHPTLSRNQKGAPVGRLAIGFILAAGLIVFLWARGQSANRVSGTVADWPLKFNHLQFGGACFDTVTCSIIYNNFEFGLPKASLTRSSLSAQQYDTVMSASYGPVARTAPPARLNWISKDGSKLEALVDIAAIFSDKLIRHSAKREEIAEGVSMGSTHVIVEIKDRSVSVYTRTQIWLKQPLDPANRYTNVRNDLIKVYSRTH